MDDRGQHSPPPPPAGHRLIDAPPPGPSANPVLLAGGPGPRLESLTRLGNYAAAGVCAVAALEVLFMFAALVFFFSAPRGALVLLAVFLPILYLVLALAGIPFIIWFHRAYGRLRMLGVETRFSPGMAIGCWFIPFANWVLPGMIGDEIWRAGRPPGRPPAGDAWNLARVWWGVYIGTGLIAFFPLLVGGVGGSSRVFAFWVLLSAALLLVSAGFAIAFVRRAGERLDALDGLPAPGDGLDRAILSVYSALPIPGQLTEEYPGRAPRG